MKSQSKSFNRFAQNLNRLLDNLLTAFISNRFSFTQTQALECNAIFIWYIKYDNSSLKTSASHLP